MNKWRYCTYSILDKNIKKNQHIDFMVGINEFQEPQYRAWNWQDNSNNSKLTHQKKLKNIILKLAYLLSDNIYRVTLLSIF